MEKQGYNQFGLNRGAKDTGEQEMHVLGSPEQPLYPGGTCSGGWQMLNWVSSVWHRAPTTEQGPSP